MLRDQESAGRAKSGRTTVRKVDSGPLEQFENWRTSSEGTRATGGRLGEGIGCDCTTAATTATGVKAGSEIRRHPEGAGEDILTALGLRNESHREIIHLVAKFRLIADVLEGHGERHIAEAQLLDAEGAGIATS